MKGITLLTSAVLFATSGAFATERLPKKLPAHKAVIEGYVRDNTGRPVKGVKVSVNQGTYTTYGTTLILPIFTKTTVGVIGFNFPDDAHVHVRNGRSARTDKYGRYKITVRPGTYDAFMDHTANRKLWKSYRHASGPVHVSATNGNVTEQDFVLTARQ